MLSILKLLLIFLRDSEDVEMQLDREPPAVMSPRKSAGISKIILFLNFAYSKCRTFFF